MRRCGIFARSATAASVPAESYGQHALGGGKTVAFNKLSHADNRIVLVRHFNTDGGFSGNRRFNADSCGCEVHGNIVCKACDSADFYSGGGLKLIPCDCRAAAVSDVRCLNAEAVQSVYQSAAGRGNFACNILLTCALRRFQQGNIRYLVMIKYSFSCKNTL